MAEKVRKNSNEIIILVITIEAGIRLWKRRERFIGYAKLFIIL